MPNFELDAFLPYQLSLLANRASRGFAAHYETAYGINNAEWRVLAHLHNAPTVSVRDIHRRTELEKSKVSRAVTRLEARGYLIKGSDKDDSRLLSLRLTPTGKRLLSKLTKVADQYQAGALAGLSASEQRSLQRGLALLDRLSL